MTITNTVSGDGGVIKNGGSPLILTGPTTYTGDTTINGTSSIRLVAPADLSGSTNIVINATGFLTVTGMTSGTFPLVSGHTLRGNGVLNGLLNAQAGSTLSPAVTPGVSPVGRLTVSNSVTLAGTTIMQIDPVNHTNDTLLTLTTIAYGGNLSLTNITSPLTNGSTFKLFYAASYSGSFASITPASPGPGLAWVKSALTTTGTISVGPLPQPKFNLVRLIPGVGVVASGTNGTAGGQYIVLATNDIAAPVTNWPAIQTNTFDGSGNFSITNTTGQARQFYIILPQ